MKLKLNLEFEIDAETEEEAYEKLAEQFAMNNMTAETEFWSNLEVVD